MKQTMQGCERRIFYFFLMILAITLLMAALTGCKDKTPIKIGLVAGLSGRMSELGGAERSGALLAVEEINAAGGIQGRRVELIIKDDRNDPDIALQVDKELIEEGVAAIIGHATSTMSLAVTSFINQQNMLMISPTTSTMRLSGRDDFFIRITPVSDAEMKALAGVAAQHLNVKTVGVIYDLANKALTENNLTAFQTAYQELSGAIISRSSFTSGTDTSFFELVRQLLNANPDGILILAGSIDAALMCQQIRKIDPYIPILMTGWATTADLVQHGGQAVEGIHYVQVVDMNSQAPAFLQFAEKLKNAFKLEPDFGAMYAYQAVYMLHTVLKKGVNAEPKSLRDAIIEHKVFPGLQHDVVIDEFGDAQGHFELFRIQDGKFVKGDKFITLPKARPLE